jgi:DNA-directed RNA polymerase specialized sigma24 family protein
MTTQQAINTMFQNRLHTMMPYLLKTARRNEDLIQEGAIGIWESLKKYPNAANKYLATKARWTIANVTRGVGVSVDVPRRYKRKFPVSVLHYDNLPDDADGRLAQAILADRSGLPVDEAVIWKVDFERFLNTLAPAEAEYIRYKVVDDATDKAAAANLSMSIEKLYAMRAALREKIRAHFSTYA